MSDTTILYSGIFCFSLIVICFLLTLGIFRNARREPVPTARSTRVSAASIPRGHSPEAMRAKAS